MYTEERLSKGFGLGQTTSTAVAVWRQPCPEELASKYVT